MSFLLRSASRVAVSSTRAFTTSAPRPLARLALIGNLADAPELKPTSTGKELITYSLATHSGSVENRKTSWWRVSCFMDEGRRRDFMLSLPKGTHLYVEGEASMRQYTDAEGKMRSSLSIVQKNYEILKRPASDEQGEHGHDE